jgi:hypothetical protein
VAMARGGAVQQQQQQQGFGGSAAGAGGGQVATPPAAPGSLRWVANSLTDTGVWGGDLVMGGIAVSLAGYVSSNVLKC